MRRPPRPTIGPRDELLPPGLQPGAMLGAYRLVRVLGRGGMGVVFEAEDTRLHRRVALKAVSTLGGTGAEEQRLRREARAAAALVHPNVATVYALEEIDGRAYIASEYLDGETLREVVRRGPLPRDEALGIALGLASGLEAAHRQGIVHRDLKPENVLRLADGRVKILDFGLAHLEGDARQLRSGSRLTLHGLVVGTPGYMAPEQLLGAPLDGRADQFALGIVLAEMLAGVHPFEAPSLAATIARVLAADGVASSSEVSLPPDIAVVVQRLTRQRADDRYATTGEVVAALAACQAGAAALPAPDRPSAAQPLSAAPAIVDEATGRRPPLWWWRFHQAAAAAVYWGMVGPAWIVHREVAPGLPWFIGCLAATIVAANVRLHLRFTAAVLPQELASQRAKTRGWVAVADWSLVLLWAYAGTSLMAARREWAVVFFAFAIGAAVAVAPDRAGDDARGLRRPAGRGTLTRPAVARIDPRVRAAERRHRAGRARRLARRAGHRPEVHQRLVEVEGPGPRHQRRRQRPQPPDHRVALGIAPADEHAVEHAGDVGVEDRRPLAEGEAQDRAGGVFADALERQQRLAIGGQRAAVAGHRLAGDRVQPLRADVVAERAPGGRDVGLGGGGQRLERRGTCPATRDTWAARDRPASAGASSPRPGCGTGRRSIATADRGRGGRTIAAARDGSAPAPTGEAASVAERECLAGAA